MLKDIVKLLVLNPSVTSSWSELQSPWINAVFGDWGRQRYFWRGRVTEVRLSVFCVRTEPSHVPMYPCDWPISVCCRAGSVCSMESFPMLSRTSSRNMERDWENGSIASSITSAEYNGEQKKNACFQQKILALFIIFLARNWEIKTSFGVYILYVFLWFEEEQNKTSWTKTLKVIHLELICCESQMPAIK